MNKRAMDERGTLAIELAVIAPVLIVGFLLLIVYAGRITQVQGDLRSAAHSAARAASINNDAAGAYNAATANAKSNLVFSELNCQESEDEQIDVIWKEEFDDALKLSFVTVKLTCTVSLADFAFLRVPGSRTFRAEASEVIDRYRA